LLTIWIESVAVRIEIISPIIAPIILGSVFSSFSSSSVIVIILVQIGKSVVVYVGRNHLKVGTEMINKG
jgi:hypothetical protein